MAQIIRMTESDLHNMISETVLRILTEGEGWEAFKKGLNLKGIGQYAKSRIWDDNNEHKIGQSPDELKEKEYYDAHMKYAKENGTSNNFDAYKQSKNQSTESSSENNQQ